MTSGKWLWRLILLFILFDEMKTSAELLRMIFICQWYGRTTTSFVQIIIITLNFKKDLVRYLHGTANKHQLDLYFIGGCLVVAFLVLDPGLFFLYKSLVISFSLHLQASINPFTVHVLLITTVFLSPPLQWRGLAGSSLSQSRLSFFCEIPFQNQWSLLNQESWDSQEKMIFFISGQ